MLNIINKGSIQNKFIDYLNGNDYVFKYKHYSFLIFSCKKIQKELESLLTDVFIDPIFLYTEEDVIVIYHDEEVDDNEFLDIAMSLSIDGDEKIKVLKGCNIDISNRECLDAFYSCYLKFKDKEYIYAQVSDMILDLVSKNEIKDLVKIKKLILYKILEDNQLVKLIMGMFECDLNVTKTASFMYMHRNTINNKIEYIKKETGFNIQRFKDAMCLYLMIKMV